MEDGKENNSAAIFFVIVLIAAIFILIIWIGIFISKLIYKYSRSVIASVSFFIFHMSFIYVGFNFGEGEGESAISGWEVIQYRYLNGINPITIYIFVIFAAFIFSILMHSRLSEDQKYSIRQDTAREREARADRGLLGKLAILAGVGYVGAKAGYAAGKNLL
jgi:hypothetical protein